MFLNIPKLTFGVFIVLIIMYGILSGAITSAVASMSKGGGKLVGSVLGLGGTLLFLWWIGSVTDLVGCDKYLPDRCSPIIEDI